MFWTSTGAAGRFRAITGDADAIAAAPGGCLLVRVLTPEEHPHLTLRVAMDTEAPGLKIVAGGDAHARHGWGEGASASDGGLRLYNTRGRSGREKARR